MPINYSAIPFVSTRRKYTGQCYIPQDKLNEIVKYSRGVILDVSLNIDDTDESKMWKKYIKNNDESVCSLTECKYRPVMKSNKEGNDEQISNESGQYVHSLTSSAESNHVLENTNSNKIYNSTFTCSFCNKVLCKHCNYPAEICQCQLTNNLRKIKRRRLEKEGENNISDKELMYKRNNESESYCECLKEEEGKLRVKSKQDWKSKSEPTCCCIEVNTLKVIENMMNEIKTITENNRKIFDIIFTQNEAKKDHETNILDKSTIKKYLMKNITENLEMYNKIGNHLSESEENKNYYENETKRECQNKCSERSEPKLTSSKSIQTEPSQIDEGYPSVAGNLNTKFTQTAKPNFQSKLMLNKMFNILDEIQQQLINSKKSLEKHSLNLSKTSSDESVTTDCLTEEVGSDTQYDKIFQLLTIKSVKNIIRQEKGSQTQCKCLICPHTELLQCLCAECSQAPDLISHKYSDETIKSRKSCFSFLTRSWGKRKSKDREQCKKKAKYS